MAVPREVTDDEILATLEKLDPKPAAEVSDDDILATLNKIDPVEQGPRAMGTLEATAPMQAHLGRLGAQAAGRAVSAGVSLYNLHTKLMPGHQEPIRFSSRDLVRRLEDVGVLGEARAVERITERAGDSAAFAATASGAGAALVASGVPNFLAQSIGMLGPTMLDMFQEGEAAGVKIEPAEYAKAAAASLALLPISMVTGNAINRTVEKLLRRELGEATQAAVRNAAIGGLFEGGTAFVTGDPRWYEAAAAGVLGFQVNAALDSYFPGKSRPRTRGQVEASVSAAGRAMDEFGVGVKNSPPPGGAETPGQAEALAKIRYNQALNSHLNDQVLLGARPLRGKKAAADRRRQALEVQKHFDVDATTTPKAAADGLVRQYGISNEEAQEIIARKPTQGEVDEILADKATEAMLVEAEERGPGVLRETAYQNDLMTDGQKRLYEAARAQMPPEEIAALEASVPTKEEGEARVLELERGPEPVPAAEPAPRPEPARGARVARGMAMRQAAEPAPKPKVPQEQQKRLKAAGLKPVKAEPAPVKPKRGIVYSEVSDVVADIVSSMESKATPLPQPRGVKKGPKPPTEATVGEVFDRPPRVPKAADLVKIATTEPREPRAVEQAQRILGKKAQQPLPPPPKPTTEAQERALRKSRGIIEKATAKLEKANEARLKLRPKLSKQDRDRLMYGAAAVGAVGATALASDEDTETIVKAGLPFAALAFLRGRRLHPDERWALKIAAAERSKALEAAIAPQVDKVIAQGGRMSAKQQGDMLRNLQEALPKVPKPVHEWNPQEKEIFVRTIGNQIARSGPVGKQLNRLIQSFVRRKGQMEEHYKNRLRNVDTGDLKMRADHPLSKSDQADVQNYMDHVIGAAPEGSKRVPFDSLSDAAKREVTAALQFHFGHETGDAKYDAPARAWNDAQRNLYADFETQNTESLLAWTPFRHGQEEYRPQPFREEAYRPDASLQVNNPAEFKRRITEMNRLRDLIAADTGYTRVEVDRAFDAMQGLAQEGSLLNRGLETDDTHIRLATNIDFHRLLNTLVGRKWDSVGSSLHYIDQASTRLPYVQHFGHNGEIARTLIDAMSGTGKEWKREQLVKMFDAATFQDINLSGWLGKYMAPAVREMTAFTAFKHLGGFALSNLVGGSLIPAHVGKNYYQGAKRTIGSAAEAFKTSIDQSTIIPKSAKKSLAGKLRAEFIADAGAATQSVHLQMLENMKGVMPKVLSGYLKAFGGQIDRYWRNLAAISADKYFLKLHDEMKWAKRRGMDDDVKNLRLHFRELFEDPIHRSMAEDADLPPEKLHELRLIAAETVARRSQNRTTPVDMPLMASDPLGRPLFTLSSYGIRQTAEFQRQIQSAMENPAVRNRILAGWLVATGTAFGVLQLQRMRRGKEPFDPEKDSLAREILESLTYAGIGPAYYDAFRDLSGERGNQVVNVSPVVRDLVDMGGLIPSSRAEGTPAPIARYILKSLPQVHPAQKKLPEAVFPKSKRPEKPKKPRPPKRPE